LAIEGFCFPSGLLLSHESKRPTFACFVLTLKDGQRLYGHSLTVHQPLPRHTRVSLSTEEGGGEKNVEELSGGEGLYAPCCLCLLSSGHYPLAFKTILTKLHEMCAHCAAVELAVETSLSHLVLNVPLPVSGGPTVRFRLCPSEPWLHVSCSHPSQLPHTDYSVGILFKRLSPSSLLKVFHALLLEQQLVVCSDDEELRLGACELLLGFLHPLQWAQVYVPTIPDAWVDLLSNPFPCLLGLRSSQLKHLPSPLPSSMCLLNLTDGHVSGPSRKLPPLPQREAHRIQQRLAAVHDRWKTTDVSVADASIGLSLTAHDSAPSLPKQGPALLEARARAAFLELFVSLLRDLDRFVPDLCGKPPPPAEELPGEEQGVAARHGWGEEELDARVEAFIAAQPATSRKFLEEMVRTQLFLSFVQPVEELCGTIRGGRCFALARDAFIRREIVTIAEDDDIQQQRKAVQLIGGSASLPEWVEQPDGSFLRKGVGGGAGDPGGEGEDPLESEWNADDLLGAMPRQPAKLYEVPSPTVASPPPDGGFTYDSGVFPTVLPPSLLASQLPLPAFEGEPMRPLRVTPQLRAAWSEALANLEARQEQRTTGKIVAGVSSGLVMSAVAMTACSIQ
ncbi:MAG: hypothetical protein SGPRY_001838, partial [Prymnesium sp.]